MCMKIVGEEKWIGEKNLEEETKFMEKVFTQIDGKLLEPTNYQLQKI